jgi:hypothetical protein
MKGDWRTAMAELASAIQRDQAAAPCIEAGPPAAPEERLAVLRYGYRERLRAVLQEEHPRLRRCLGADLFDAMALDYVAQHPPRSSTLYDLGEGLLPFLTRHCPDPEAPPFLYPLTLGRLERHMLEAARAAGPEADLPSGIDSPGALLQARLADSTRLLESRYAPEELLEERPPAAPGPPRLLVVCRQAWRLEVVEASPWQSRWLLALKGGSRLADLGEAEPGLLDLFANRALRYGWLTVRPG